MPSTIKRCRRRQPNEDDSSRLSFLHRSTWRLETTNAIGLLVLVVSLSSTVNGLISPYLPCKHPSLLLRRSPSLKSFQCYSARYKSIPLRTMRPSSSSNVVMMDSETSVEQSFLPAFLQDTDDDDDDSPRPTPAGGFTHTAASRAKISAANKGKTPWNKGKTRSEEVKQKIAEGVRRRNRERFLQQLAEQGLTEEEYEAQQLAEEEKLLAERLARKTAKGGFRPTDETRQKISQKLREKYANGDVKPRRVDPSRVRRGFTHSEETRAKISESLRKRWADDEEYRKNMIEKSTAANTNHDVRKKISESLRKKWEDPEFRQEMMSRMARKSNGRSGGPRAISHREKISEAMKAKWQDEEYRNKTLEAIQRRKEEMARLRPPAAPKIKSSGEKKQTIKVKKSSPRKKEDSVGTLGVLKGRTALPNAEPVVIRVVEPLSKPRRASATTRKQQQQAQAPKMKVLTPTKKSPSDERAVVVTGPKKKKAEKKHIGTSSSVELQRNGEADDTAESKKIEKKRNGNVDLLREERRDLYDLLYGDDEDVPSKLASVFALGDENLDEFDPYGLDDF